MAKPSHKDRNFKAAGVKRPPGPRTERVDSGVPPPSVSRAHLLYGAHAVAAAWLNPERRCRRLYATHVAAESFAATLAEAATLGLKRPEITPIERDAIDRLLPAGAVHQGLALDAEPLAESNLDDALIRIGESAACLVLLDQVTDPHNVGAILRSAAAFGAAGLIVQSRHAPEVTGVLAKAASGAVEIVPILRETNLSRSIAQLRDAGFVVIGLDEAGPLSLDAAPIGRRMVLALGAEGVGLRRLVAESCDVLVALPTVPPLASLNVSNAAAVGLYEIARRR